MPPLFFVTRSCSIFTFTVNDAVVFETDPFAVTIMSSGHLPAPLLVTTTPLIVVLLATISVIAELEGLVERIPTLEGLFVRVDAHAQSRQRLVECSPDENVMDSEKRCPTTIARPSPG